MAREALQQELNIIEIVKAQRLLKVALKHLLQPEKLSEFKRSTRYKIIDPDKKTEDNLKVEKRGGDIDS